jgi:uncharacterized membrane protein YjjP (DUF1212 family)
MRTPVIAAAHNCSTILMPSENPPISTGPLLQFLLRLGQAYLACGEQTAVVELFLQRVATARGLRRVRVVTFPTAIFISVHDGEQEHVTLSEGATRRVRLDQVAAVYQLGEAAQRGSIGPKEGLEQLDEIYGMTPRFGAVGVVIGHAMLTIGLAIVLMPTQVNIAAAAVLGVVVGVLKVINRDQPILAAPLSVVAAGLVSALVFLAVKYGLPVEPRYALVPPLVTFLPGAMLAFGLVELTYGDMVSGSSRLNTGIVQLVLLAFGLVAGALLVGYNVENLLDGSQELAIPLWKSASGVLLFGVGVSMHYSAPRGSLAWLLLVLLVAFAAQSIASIFVGSEMSGFFGMLAATPLGNLIQYRFRGPPSMVTFLPSFWLLVPGALGLSSVKRLLSGSAGLDGIITVVLAFTAIALGTLVGESLSKWLGQKFARAT